MIQSLVESCFIQDSSDRLRSHFWKCCLSLLGDQSPLTTSCRGNAGIGINCPMAIFTACGLCLVLLFQPKCSAGVKCVLRAQLLVANHPNAAVHELLALLLVSAVSCFCWFCSLHCVFRKQPVLSPQDPNVWLQDFVEI